MRRALVILTTVLMVGLLAVPAGAGSGGNGAKKAPLYQGTSWTCGAGASATGATHGFAVMNLNAKGTLIGTVSLKGAAPNATYSIWIAGTKIPGQGTYYPPTTLTNCPQTPLLGYLKTNAAGNGTFHFKIEGVVPQSAAWIIAEGGGPRLQTPAVALK